MDDILQDEAKTDDMIYQELLEKIETTKKSFSFFSMIKALFVVRRGLGIQAAELLKPFDPTSLKGYLEIYNRRYAGSIQKYAGLSFKKTAALCDQVATTFKDRVEGGTFFYPYQKILPLNDADCKDPSLEVEKTYQPIGSDIEDESIDVMGCLGGLHHVPEHRLDFFARSMAKKLKPGGVCLLRDHNAGDEKIKAIASVVHSFVNAVDQVSLEKEVLEIRNFQSEEYWTHLMEKHGFSRIDKKSLVLKNDPTQNGMMAFVKKPKNKKEMEIAASFQKDYKKSPIGSYATWIEWGNLRYSKQYSKFIHQNHSYAFDFVGHISQHWTHFYYTLQQSLAHPMGKVKEVFLSDNSAMNLFIVLGTTVQLAFSAVTSFPSVCFARWRYGKNWKDVANLSAVEKEEAKFQEDYSTFIDYDPFFKYPYFKTIDSIWKAVFYSKDSYLTKVMNIPSAISLTLPIGAQGLLSKFIESIYYSPEASSDQEVIQVMVQDPYNEIDTVIQKWNEEKLKTLFKGKTPYQNCEMKVIYSTAPKNLYKSNQ